MATNCVVNNSHLHATTLVVIDNENVRQENAVFNAREWMNEGKNSVLVLGRPAESVRESLVMPNYKEESHIGWKRRCNRISFSHVQNDRAMKLKKDTLGELE